MPLLKNFSFNTDQGPYLQVNEDAIEIDIKRHLFILVDGIGGSHIGDKAASTIKTTIKTAYTTFTNDPNSTLPFFYAQRYSLEGNALINALYQTHVAMKKENEEKKTLDKMGGGSVVVVCQNEHIATLVGTGNCAAYLYRRGRLKTLIEPDILNALSESLGHSATAPLSGLGLFEDANFTIREYKILEEDTLILMSDGAYGRIEDEELRDIIGRDGKSYEEKICSIFKLSNSRGNLDNQSCLILNY